MYRYCIGSVMLFAEHIMLWEIGLLGKFSWNLYFNLAGVNITFLVLCDMTFSPHKREYAWASPQPNG